MICPVCRRENGELVRDRSYGGGGETFEMCRPCQIVSDIVEAAPLTAYMPSSMAESVEDWMCRLQDELADEIKARSVA